MLTIYKTSGKNSKGSNSSTRKGKSPRKLQPSSNISQQNQLNNNVSQIQVDGLGCTRKVVFDLVDEDTRDQKKGKSSTVVSENLISMEPVNQARREQ